MTRDVPPPRRPHLRDAALLLIPLVALAFFAGCGGDAGTPPDEKPPAAPEPLAPRGAVPLPEAFTWKMAPGDRIYRLTVTDAAERPLYQQDVRNGASLPLAKELAAMMAEPHATFSWSVAIVTPDGRTLAQSPTVQFWLK
jgi:hypothetical protein